MEKPEVIYTVVVRPGAGVAAYITGGVGLPGLVAAREVADGLVAAGHTVKITFAKAAA